jgi:hypothetical protein
MAPEMKKYVMS